MTSAFDYADRRRRAADSLGQWGVDTLLVTTPADLRYFTGFGGTAPLGPNPFTGGPSAALLLTSDGAILCLPESDVALVAGDDASLALASYPTFLDLHPLHPRLLFVEALADVFAEVGLKAGVLGYQGTSLPVAVDAVLRERYPEIGRRELEGAVGHLRMRKSPAEIEALRRSVAVCDRAQAAVTAALHSGVTELEIASEVERVVSESAGNQVPLILEVTSGPRSGRIGNAPSERRLEEGDLVLTDIAPQVEGYWGDSCATQPVGAIDDERRRMLRISLEALETGTEAVRPGVRASEVDREMREHVGTAFPPYHNSGGHGIGCDYHEPPRLVPTEEIELDEGMVLAMEPGIYLPEKAGVRLEHIVLVTRDGCEVLSKHQLTGS